jgi:hypothetical protein
MSESTRDSSNLRKAHNAELIRRMMKGESLTSFDSQSSWYPPRPVIEKDPSEIARLYETAQQVETSTNKVEIDQGNVVQMHGLVVPLKVLDDAS